MMPLLSMVEGDGVGQDNRSQDFDLILPFALGLTASNPMSLPINDLM